MTTSTPKPILISGAGLSSLLLAQSLHRSKIPFRIYERDASLSFRAQGYRLLLSAKGLSAIETVLGPSDFQRFWDICGKTAGGGGGFAQLDARTGEKIIEKDTPPSREAELLKPRLENLAARDGKIVGISRGDMRKLFMEGLEDFVNWSHHVVSYELTDSGVYAIFADGSKSVEGSLLVGGDGISSKVAKKLSKGLLKVYDTGARGIHGQAPSTAFKGLGEGVWSITDQSNPSGRLFIITNVRSGDKDDPNVQLGWTMGSTPGIIRAPNDDYTIIGKPAADLAKHFTKDWNAKLRPLFEEMNVEDAAFWKITCSTPTGVPVWENEGRITVIGDAAHSMTPAGGIGANTAVRDSALLGGLLSEKGGWAEGVTRQYEEGMRVYASEAVKYSYAMAQVQMGVVIDENSKTV